MRADDPSSAIDSPKLGRPLPKILSLAEVETLLDTAKRLARARARAWRKRRALRLYALLETLYATGLRVSELIALPRAVLTADDRVLTIKGKGGRERLVPLNETARKAIADASRRGRARTRRKEGASRLGCSRRRAASTSRASASARN